MKHVRKFKPRDIWNFFRSIGTTAMGFKVFQNPIRRIRKGKEAIAGKGASGQRRGITSLQSNKQRTKSAVRKGAGTREGVRQLRADILLNCDKLLKHYNK